MTISDKINLNWQKTGLELSIYNSNDSGILLTTVRTPNMECQFCMLAEEAHAAGLMLIRASKAMKRTKDSNAIPAQESAD
jgi:hypothetical protein